jgi:hypothetical protein
MMSFSFLVKRTGEIQEIVSTFKRFNALGFCHLFPFDMYVYPLIYISPFEELILISFLCLNQKVCVIFSINAIKLALGFRHRKKSKINSSKAQN